MAEAKPKPKRYKAKVYLMTGLNAPSTGGNMAVRTEAAGNVVGGTVSFLPGPATASDGLPMKSTPVTSGSTSMYITPKSMKHNATLPLVEAVNTVKKLFMGRMTGKTDPTPAYSAYRGVFIYEHALTRVADKEGGV